ncbi:TlpA family protein disulfide reductase [Fibrella sp. USSR17]
MKTLLVIACYCMLTSSLAQQTPDFSINTDGKSVLRIQYQSNSRVRPLFTYTHKVLPYGDNQRRDSDSILLGSGEKFIHFQVATPQRALLTIANRGSVIYLLPNDTLTLVIDLSPATTWESYHFYGKGAAITQYYFDQARSLTRIPERTRALLANHSATLPQYAQRMDSLLQVEQQFLKNYLTQHTLPDWFVEQEQQQILYNDATYRANAVSYRRFIKMDSIDAVPKDFFAFVTPSLLNNQSAAHLADYQSFINNYFWHIYHQQKPANQSFKFFPALADKQLSGLAWEVFMARYIGQLLADAPTEGESLLKHYYPTFRHKLWLDSLTAYYENAYTLKPGQLAPKFALEDNRDSLTYLNEFRGNVVYVSFWFTGCAPCRQEMPFENELVTYFAGKPVKIVNICVNSTRENWAKVSNLYKLQTVNLFANKAWATTLISKYNVRAYPHYVLIDQAGKVVKNNCARPSGEAKREIEALLQ